MTEPAPERVRVTGPPQRAGHRRARTSEIDDQTAARLGADGLADPRPSCGWRCSPCCRCWPSPSAYPSPSTSRRAWPTYASLGVPLAWLVLGGLVYPFLFLLGRSYVRRAERNEQDFAELVDIAERPSDGATVNGTAPSIVAVVLVTVATLAIGTWGLRFSRTTSDFFVASRTVRPALNASAIGGEYLSAASFLGVAGLVLAFGADMLWYPVGWTAGYLVLLVLVAAPLRRSGAYTLPDFAEARLASPRVRAASSLLVVAIGWLYLLPQFQGAGLVMEAALGAPRWLGAVVVAVVVLVNVLSGGMRSITFVQAFQYWLKLTALLVPAVVLLGVWVDDGAPNPADVAARR